MDKSLDIAQIAESLAPGDMVIVICKGEGGESDSYEAYPSEEERESVTPPEPKNLSVAKEKAWYEDAFWHAFFNNSSKEVGGAGGSGGSTLTVNQT